MSYLGLGTWDLFEVASPDFHGLNDWYCTDWPQVTWDELGHVWTGLKIATKSPFKGMQFMFGTFSCATFNKMSLVQLTTMTSKWVLSSLHEYGLHNQREESRGSLLSIMIDQLVDILWELWMISCLYEWELAIIIVVIAIRHPLSSHLIWMKKYGSAI